MPPPQPNKQTIVVPSFLPSIRETDGEELEFTRRQTLHRPFPSPRKTVPPAHHSPRPFRRPSPASPRPNPRTPQEKMARRGKLHLHLRPIQVYPPRSHGSA